MSASAFIRAQREAQTAYFDRFENAQLMPGCAYRLAEDHAAENLNPAFRQAMLDHFAGDAGRHAIQWHRHRNHALSSQVCCVNFLGPLMYEPKALSQIVGNAFGIAPPTMRPVGRDKAGNDIYVDFEWIGSKNYLDEWPENGEASRGANATSADAVVRMVEADGTVTTVLIEWKYTEKYGAPLADNPQPGRGNDKRRKRYADKLIYPAGPFRADCGLAMDAFFWEPHYQLARQQMLAFQMEKEREDGATRVVVLHLSPTGNKALHRTTSRDLKRFGDDVFEVHRELLVESDRFQSASIEDTFGPALRAISAGDPGSHWAGYLLGRYKFLCGTAQ